VNLRLDFEAKVLAAFAAATLVVATFATITWKVAEGALEAAIRVARTLEVLDGLADTKVETVQIELSTQNYRITGDAAALSPLRRPRTRRKRDRKGGEGQSAGLTKPRAWPASRLSIAPAPV
jgi:hypothetical protein